MPSLDEINEQMEQAGIEKSVFSRKEVRELPAILWENERIERAIQGSYNNRIGLLVATDRRLIFVDKGIMSLKVEDFPTIRLLQYSIKQAGFSEKSASLRQGTEPRSKTLSKIERALLRRPFAIKSAEEIMLRLRF